MSKKKWEATQIGNTVGRLTLKHEGRRVAELPALTGASRQLALHMVNSLNAGEDLHDPEAFVAWAVKMAELYEKEPHIFGNGVIAATAAAMLKAKGKL